MTPADDARARNFAVVRLDRTVVWDSWGAYSQTPDTPVSTRREAAYAVLRTSKEHILEVYDAAGKRLAPASPAATTEQGQAVATAESDIPGGVTPVSPAPVSPPTPDATAALLAEADDFIAEQGDSYFARSFARFAAALRAEQEKGKELDRSNAAVVRQHGELQDEIVRLRERLADAEAFTQKYLTAIAQAIGIDSPLILIAHAESNEENYADILLKLVTASGELLAAFEALAVEAKAVVASGWRCDDWDNVVAKLAALASDDAKGAT